MRVGGVHQQQYRHIYMYEELLVPFLYARIVNADSGTPSSTVQLAHMKGTVYFLITVPP